MQEELFQRKSSFCLPTEPAEGRGRPRFSVTEEQLKYFLDMSFSVQAISRCLGVSRSTIQRRLREFGLSVSETYSILSDDELDAEIRLAKTRYPDSGYQLNGFLVQKGIRVQQKRLRESLRRTDPFGVVQRYLLNVHRRRVYSVYAPQALWHIDGKHKLIR